ncbi:hypothetical protein W97_02639 [Coniosporium apollinis CBS 100218]|uniref:Uncharacterized protein n=1 Tax=Coniosporium apollinis (strain CBS 100218) TaxID=1168221 RepID=R7YND6_CONA1|nr:uncharacterized protein W97_02639 [Coniosporium apollinis CBS 100218]EON63412.1 hypothetical protein W97_02639 [Coniosporium apollinis CBS 100218]
MPHKKNVDRFGATRLARECEKGDLKTVQGAYDAAPDELDQQDYAGITPLQKAALNGFPDVVKFLLQKGCRTDCQNSDRDTPLIDAVENGHFEVVKILLNVARVNPHHQNKQGQRALDVLREDVDDAEEIEKELRRAMQRESNGADESARDAGASQDASSTNLLYNEYNTETLRIKAAEGNMGAVAELLNSNIKPNMACGAAAARGGHDEILSILLGFGMKADPDPMKHSETPMLAAIGRGHLKVIKLLLEQDNFDPTRRNREGKTYWEVAEERRGPKWQQERDTLKEHYNEYRRQHQRSPKKSRARHLSPTRSQTNNRENGRKTTASSEPPKGRGRLVSARELQQRELQQHRELKRRRRVVADESESESDDSDVRGPVKPAAKAKPKPSYDAPRDNGLSSPEAPEKRLGRKSGSGERSRKSDTVPRDAPPPELDAMEDIKQETPEPIKTERLAKAERLAEAERLEAEKAAEKAAAEAREAEEAEKTRLATEQARIAAEKAQRDREERLQALPRALRRALQRGKNRPLHFDGEEMGISANFLPVHRVRFKEIDPDSPESHHDEWWILSFQAAGILGLPQLDLIEFPDWERHPVTEPQRQRFLRGYDLAQLAQDFRFPMEGCAEFDPQAIERVMAETRAQFLKMPLEWVRWDDFEAALRGGGYEHLANLKVTTASYIHVHDPAVVNGDVRKPRSFLDVILGSAAARNESHS